jgi:hypothetical protein
VTNLLRSEGKEYDLDEGTERQLKVGEGSNVATATATAMETSVLCCAMLFVLLRNENCIRIQENHNSIKKR